MIPVFFRNRFPASTSLVHLFFNRTGVMADNIAGKLLGDCRFCQRWHVTFDSALVGAFVKDGIVKDGMPSLTSALSRYFLSSIYIFKMCNSYCS